MPAPGNDGDSGQLKKQSQRLPICYPLESGALSSSQRTLDLCSSQQQSITLGFTGGLKGYIMVSVLDAITS